MATAASSLVALYSWFRSAKRMDEKRLNDSFDEAPAGVPDSRAVRARPVVTSRSTSGAAARTVLFVSLSGWLAGPGRSLATVISNLPDDFEAVLACPATGDLYDAVRAQRPSCQHLPLPRRPGQHSDPFARLQAVAVLAAWVLRHRSRLLAIHANGFSELHVSAFASFVSRRRVVVWLHGHESNPWDRTLGRLWHRALAGLATCMAVSEVARARAVEAGLKDAWEIGILPNPIDPADVVATRGRRDGAVSSAFTCAFLSGERNRKGFYQLPELADRLDGSGVLLAVCDAPQPTDSPAEQAVWEHLLAAGPRRVAALGYVKEVRDVYARCDAVLVLSPMESFNRVVAEAGANALPVVATDIEAHRVRLGADEAGILFPIGDLAAAAAAIIRLRDDPELCRRLGAEGRDRAAALSPKPLVYRLVELYRGSNQQPDGPKQKG